MASAVDSRLAYARLSAVAMASRLPTANRGSTNSYTTSWDTTCGGRQSCVKSAAPALAQARLGSAAVVNLTLDTALFWRFDAVKVNRLRRL